MTEANDLRYLCIKHFRELSFGGLITSFHNIKSKESLQLHGHGQAVRIQAKIKAGELLKVTVILKYLIICTKNYLWLIG